MINVKDKVYAALCTVCDNVSDIYPRDWEEMPAITYVEERNVPHTITDNEEQLSDLRYRIDIWSSESTTELSIKVDQVISALGLVRTECTDVTEPMYLRHKQMRYEGYIDNETEVVYWDGNR